MYMKRVAAFLHQYTRKEPPPYHDYHKVVDMHDEAQWEIPNREECKEEFSMLVQCAFEEANEFYKLRCPQEPDVLFGYTWAETH